MGNRKRAVKQSAPEEKYISAEMLEAQRFRHFFFCVFGGGKVDDNGHSIRVMLLA